MSSAIDQLMAFAISKMDHRQSVRLSCGGIFFVSALYMKTMARLRVANIVSNFFFLLYGYLAPAFPTFLMYVALLPINFFRLYQLRDLISKVKSSAQGDLYDGLAQALHEAAHSTRRARCCSAKAIARWKCSTR